MASRDKQVGGDHYKKHGDLQPWDIIDHYGLGFYEGNALKYLLRWKDKGGIEDIRKCIHYLERIIDLRMSKPQSIVDVDVDPYKAWRSIVDGIKNVDTTRSN